MTAIMRISIRDGPRNTVLTGAITERPPARQSAVCWAQSLVQASPDAAAMLEVPSSVAF
jgi:hypothetical protein